MKLIVKVGGKVLTSMPKEGAIEGGGIKYAGRKKLSALKASLPSSPCRKPRTSKKKKRSFLAEKKLDIDVKIKPKTLREKMEAFYESWETEDYYDGNGWDYENRYYRHLNQQFSTSLHDGANDQLAAEKMEKPEQSTVLVSTNEDFVQEKITKNKKRKPQTLREKMEAFYESWETEDYYDGDGWDYEDRYCRHLNQQLIIVNDKLAAEKMEKPEQSTAFVSTNEEFVLEKITKNKKRKLTQES